MKHWLMKSEPDEFSIDDLEKLGQSQWDGVRNYQARNFMREMNTGDLVFFYHSSCKLPAIVGIAEVVKEAYPDHTSWDPNSPYFDPKSTEESPRWDMVEIKFTRKASRIFSLQEMKTDPQLQGFKLIERGSRLSVLPVSEPHAEYIKNRISE